MKIALYEILDIPERYQYIKEATEDAEKDESYIRVSDIRTVDFKITDDAITIKIVTVVEVCISSVLPKRLRECSTFLSTICFPDTCNFSPNSRVIEYLVSLN